VGEWLFSQSVNLDVTVAPGKVQNLLNYYLFDEGLIQNNRSFLATGTLSENTFANILKQLGVNIVDLVTPLVLPWRKAWSEMASIIAIKSCQKVRGRDILEPTWSQNHVGNSPLLGTILIDV